MNAKNSVKDNLVHVAVQNGHVDITQLLLDKGTSTETVDVTQSGLASYIWPPCHPVPHDVTYLVDNHIQ